MGAHYRTFIVLARDEPRSLPVAFKQQDRQRSNSRKLKVSQIGMKRWVFGLYYFHTIWNYSRLENVWFVWQVVGSNLRSHVMLA